MTFAQVEAEAQGAYERGDALGALRRLRDYLQTRPGPTEAGRAHTAIAELYIRVGGSSMARIRAELGRARELLAQSKDYLPLALLTSMRAACTDNNEAEATCWHRAYIDLCRRHPSDVAVSRYRGRFTCLLGRLARARGAHALATKHYHQAMSEYRRYESDRSEAQKLSRMAHAWMAWHLLRLGQTEEARHHLDECDGPVFSPAWEVTRASFEVEYHLAVDNLSRAQFWLSLARQWCHPRAEANVRVQYCEALVARARGRLDRAATLAVETRRLAASLKQDDLLSEIRQFLCSTVTDTPPLAAHVPGR